MTQTTTTNPPPRIPKWLLNVQTFLLRRNMMGPVGNALMVITTTGRKSGKQFSVPIGNVRDGSTVYAFTLGGTSNWYRNLMANPLVTLNIRGKEIQARATPITTDAELLNALEVYKREAPNQMERFFHVSPSAQGADLLKAKERAVFVRFDPV
jgi:deazaflavin-dependent oxidoreductase (nitroreductase family)